MSLIPHCLPFIVIVFPFFFFFPSLPLHRRSMPERKWRKAISHRWNGGTFSPRLFIRIDPRYVIPFMEKSRGKSCCLVNPIIHSDFPGIHAVTYRDAVRSWEYLQLVGPSVRWVDVKKKDRSGSSFNNGVPGVENNCFPLIGHWIERRK